MAEVWRVVLRDGSVREVSVDRMGRLPVTASWDNYRCDGVDPWHAISEMSATLGFHVAEILAPGELTRAEAVAFERGRDAVDEAGARAMRAAALRDAVAAERERCARWCDEVAAERRERLRALESEGISPHDPARIALVVAITDAERCAAKIRAGGV